MSLGNQPTFLLSFLESSKVKMIDLEKASMKLRKFKPVDFFSNYALFDFDMDVPQGLSNAVIGAYLEMSSLPVLSYSGDI